MKLTFTGLFLALLGAAAAEPPPPWAYGFKEPPAACHGPDFNGLTLPEVGTMPGLVGRSPSYLFRQLFDLKSGLRHGKRVELMQPVVANVNPDAMLAIAAYLASRTP